MVYQPETYYLEPNRHAPNSDLPVLIYRDCLPLPLSEAKSKELFESHAWIQGGTWGHISTRHFHPNTHECYGVFQGESTLLLGCGKNDTGGGQEIDVRAGDVIVLPAGTAHCSTQSSQDYRYIGVYPEVIHSPNSKIITQTLIPLLKGAPKWRNELGKEPIDLEVFRQETTAVAMPKEDPVNGPDGPLTKLWTA